MRKFLLVAVMCMVSGPAWAETVRVGVNGLVCAFCVKGIENSFRREPAVDSVKVDLDTKQVTLVTKPGQALDDVMIEQHITDAGYAMTGIVHEK